MNVDLKNRLSDFQTSPSQKVWDNITKRLDEDTDYFFVEKPYHYKTTPQLQVWNRINTELDKGFAPIIPLQLRYHPALKYIGVAILMAGIILTTFFVVNSPASNEALTTKKQSPIIQAPTAENTFPVLNSEDEEIANNKPEVNSGKNRNTRIARTAPINSLSLSKPSLKGTTIIATNRPLVQSEVIDRYIVFSKATGEGVKLSKKLFSLFACYDDDQNCKQNIERVQRKMASPTIIASADFTGVLETLQSMDNQ